MQTDQKKQKKATKGIKKAQRIIDLFNIRCTRCSKKMIFDRVVMAYRCPICDNTIQEEDLKYLTSESTWKIKK